MISNARIIERENLWKNCLRILASWKAQEVLYERTTWAHRGEFKKFYAAVCDKYQTLEDGRALPCRVDTKMFPRRRAALALWLAMGGSSSNAQFKTIATSCRTVENNFALGNLPVEFQCTVKATVENPLADWIALSTALPVPPPMTDSYADLAQRFVEAVSPLTGRFKSSSLNLQTTRKFADHYQNPGQQTGQISKEKTMQQNSTTLPVEKVTLVYGRDVRQYGDDELLSKIEVIEGDITRYKAIAADSKFLQKRIADLQEAVRTIVAELDSRAAK